MIIQLLRERETCKRYDLSSVRFVFSGAAPLGEETIHKIEQRFPTWNVGQAYGEILSCALLTLADSHCQE